MIRMPIAVWFLILGLPIGLAINLLVSRYVPGGTLYKVRQRLSKRTPAHGGEENK